MDTISWALLTGEMDSIKNTEKKTLTKDNKKLMPQNSWTLIEKKCNRSQLSSKRLDMEILQKLILCQTKLAQRTTR